MPSAMPPETNSPSVDQSSTSTLPNPASPESPQLERPTASAPGPRAALFQKLYDKALDSTLKTISYENFAACFPTVAKTNDVGLREMHAGFVGKLGEFSRAEVEEIMRTRNVVENLNALEDLIADAKRRRARAIDNQDPPTPPHLLPTAAILSAYLAPQLASSQSQLNARLQTLQSQNAVLFQTIEAQKKELASLVNGLELYVKDIEGAVDGLNGNVDTLRQDVRDADTEMAGL